MLWLLKYVLNYGTFFIFDPNYPTPGLTAVGLGRLLLYSDIAYNMDLIYISETCLFHQFLVKVMVPKTLSSNSRVITFVAQEDFASDS
jgi:hypothetical protein